MSKRIILTVTQLGSKGGEVIDPEEAYYWRSPVGKILEVDFVTQTPDRAISLYGTFFIPREFTELVRSDYHACGYAVKFLDALKDWDYVSSIDCSKYRHLFSRQLDLPHADTLMSGWLRLVSAWLADTPPDATSQIQWWENYLQEEFLDFVFLCRQVKEMGIKKTLQSVRDKRSYEKWLKIASCCVELLSSKPFLLTIQLDRGEEFPCLWQGFQQMNKYRRPA